MPGVHHMIEIGARPERVFSVLADFSNDPKWRSKVVEMIPLGAAGDALGGIWSRQVEVRQVPGRQIRTEAVITAFEPSRKIGFKRASGPIRPEGTYTLTDLGGRARLEFRLDVTLAGAQVLLTPLIALMLAAIVRPTLPGDFMRLKMLVEAAGHA